MSMTYNSTMKRLCRDIADAVGDAIKDLTNIADGGVILYEGANGTPTARIDDIAEKAALCVLKEDGRSIRLVSEEVGSIVLGERPEFTIILDPVDGTYNAIHGIPFYSISIAVGGSDLSQIYYGYVKDLVTGDEYSAERAKGAFMNGKELRVADKTNLDEYCVSVNGCTPLMDFMNKNNKRIRLMGSASLELCYVASNRLDGFVDVRRRLRITDVAAGKLIIEEAGGIVTDDNGAILNSPLDVKRRVNIVAANEGIHKELITRLQG